jgi:hypothetical protein
VPTYGCNTDDLSDPDDGSFYEIGWRENDKKTKELFDLLANKTINGDDAIELCTQALYEIVGEGETGLTDSTKTRLQALP